MSSSAAQFAQQVRAANAGAKPDLFSSLSSSVEDYMGQFHSLCSPTQAALVIAIISLALHAYLLYQRAEADKPIDYERVAIDLALVAAMVGGTWYFCQEGQEDYAWVVIAAYVIAAAYGYVRNPAVKRVKSVIVSAMSPKKKVAKASPKMPKRVAAPPSPAPVVVQQAPSPQVASGLIIEQDQAIAYDPAGSKYAPVM